MIDVLKYDGWNIFSIYSSKFVLIICIILCIFWARRGKGRGCLNFSSKPSSSQCCCLVHRRGWLTTTWDDSCFFFKTRWRGYWQGGYNGGGRKEGGSKTWRRWREMRRGLSQWKLKFYEGKIRSHNIFQRERFWTCVMRMRGSRGHGWGCGGENRRDLTWRGKERQRRQHRRRTRMGWRNKGGD